MNSTVATSASPTPSSVSIPTVLLEAPAPTTSPANATTAVPTDTTTVSTNTTAAPMNTMAVPTNNTTVPTNGTAMATNNTTVPPNECSSLEPGDVTTIIFNSDPLDQIVFFALKAIPASVGSLFVTDRAWDGENFVTDEGTLEYIIPPEGVIAGTSFGYGVTMKDQSGEWAETEEEKQFDLNSVGPDSLLIYCMTADNKPFFLSALTYNDEGFSEPGQLSYDFGETALPEELTEVGNLVLPFASNYLYAGKTVKGKRDELLEALFNPSNFKGSSIVPFEINTGISAGGIPSASFVLPFLLGLMAVIL